MKASFFSLAALLIVGCTEFKERTRDAGADPDASADASTLDASASDAPLDSSTTDGSLTYAFAQRAYVKAEAPDVNDGFGARIAMSADGSTLAIGTIHEDGCGGPSATPASNDCSNAGAVYVYARNEGGAWSQQAYLKASNTGIDDAFGSSLALSADGNTLAVGAPLEDSSQAGTPNEAAPNSGAVYVFVRVGSSWSEQKYLKARLPIEADAFGTSLSLSADGNVLAVGVPGRDFTPPDEPPTANSGAVHVFEREGGDWEALLAELQAGSSSDDDLFGYAVAISGDGTWIAVGATNEDSDAVGIGGDETNDDANNSGAVYVFHHEDEEWLRSAYVKASRSGVNDFGRCVSLSYDGAMLAVGTRDDSDATGIGGEDSSTRAPNSGAAHLFAFNPDTGRWEARAYVKASNTGTNDDFGSSLALSSDGRALIVGALGESSSATGIDGDQLIDDSSESGAAYLFVAVDDGAWLQRAYVKASNTGSADRFGVAVALSADGRTFACGADREDGEATGVDGDEQSDALSNSGAAYVFDAMR